VWHSKLHPMHRTFFSFHSPSSNHDLHHQRPAFSTAPPLTHARAKPSFLARYLDPACQHFIDLPFRLRPEQLELSYFRMPPAHTESSDPVFLLPPRLLRVRELTLETLVVAAQPGASASPHTSQRFAFSFVASVRAGFWGCRHHMPSQA
jgi:hypothetical protein